MRIISEKTTMRATYFILAVSMIGLASSMVACEDTYQATQFGELRDASKGCQVSTKKFQREVESGETHDIEYSTWCAIFKNDKHIYCFAMGGHQVVGSMLYYRELAPVPDNHPDLACWAEEIKSWASLHEFEHPLRDKPKW